MLFMANYSNPDLTEQMPCLVYTTKYNCPLFVLVLCIFSTPGSNPNLTPPVILGVDQKFCAG